MKKIIDEKLDELLQLCNDLERSINKRIKQNDKLIQHFHREALRPKGE